MIGALMLLTDVPGAAPVESLAETFGVDWPFLLAQTLSFGVVCALLYWLAYGPILRILDARRQQIAQGIANTARIDAELATTRAAREQVLARAHVEASMLIEEARTVAARYRAQETQKALADAKHIVAQAAEAAAQDRDRMRRELQREVGRLVVRTTAAVTGKILTPDDQRRLAEEAVSHLAA